MLTQVSLVRFILRPYTLLLLAGGYVNRGCDGQHTNVPAELSPIPRPDFLPCSTSEPICMSLDHYGQLDIIPGYKPDGGMLPL